nr:RNA-directed DNA polymerase, eukaryota, reverse transcriptase zinc-binding domain protein [Tanacetum cinerariifolium]
EKRQIRVPNKLVDSDYGTVIAKNRRNKNKNDAKANDGIDVVLVSQNDDSVEMMNENQTGVILEEDKVEKDLNDVENGIGKVDMIDMVNKGMSAERIQNDEVQKENDEGSKKWELTVCAYFVGYNMSYQEMRYNIFIMWRKCGLKSVIPNGNGIFLFKFKSAEGLKYVTEMRPWMVNGKPMFVQKWDPSVSLDKAEPSAQPLWVKLKNLPLEAWSSKGISVVASRLGTPLIMDQTTTNMHNDKNCGSKPKTIDEFMEEEMNELKQNQVNDEFVQVQHRKKGGRKMNITENHKKETIGNKSKNVVYRPVEKSNLVAAEGTKHGTEEDQMNGMNSPKENTKQKSGIEKELQCEDKVSEEDDVFEGSGMVNSMKGIDMNVILNTNEHSAGASFVSSEMQEFKDCVNMIENNKAFKFANFVADKDDFKTIVEKEWRTKVGGFQMFQLVKKLRNLKVHLKKLAWQNGNLFEKVEKIRDNLKNIQRDIDKDPYNKALRKEEVAILKEYMTTREDEEKLLFQKSKIKWLSLGDINNSFFHKTLKGRYQKSIIENIQDVNGNSFKGQDVANQFVMHFKNFLGSSHKVEGIGECHSLFKNKVNETEALSLIEDVSSKEIVTPPKMCRSGNMYRKHYFIIQQQKI